MIHKICFCLILLGLLACSEDSDLKPTTDYNLQLSSETTIASWEVLSCSDESVGLKYEFDTNGFLQHIDLNAYSLQYEISYNSQDRISNLTVLDATGSLIVSKDLIYDATGHLLSIGTRTFDYQEDRKLYFEAEFLETDTDIFDDIVYVENRYWEYNIAPGNPIPQFCERVEQVYTNTSTGVVTTVNSCFDQESWQLNMVDGNLSTFGTEYYANYTYNQLVNPLFNPETNMEYVFGFLVRDDDFLAFIFTPLVSRNLNAWTFYGPDDPESSLLEYRSSADQLPESSRVQWYYLGNSEGSCERSLYTYH